MKLIILGDTHGREFWKYIANTQSFDKLVFIGDYFDSFDITGEQQMRNFADICTYKRANPDKVVLLIGNHDFHYTPIANYYNDRYSGFQSKLQYAIGMQLTENKDIMQMAYQYEDYLFTHAGVTNTWYNDARRRCEIGYDEIDPADCINKIYESKPGMFVFNGRDPYGDDITQSPIWVRPMSLNEDALPYTHVVGHTQQDRLGIGSTPFLNGGHGYFIDTLGTSGEYLIIENGLTSIGKI